LQALLRKKERIPNIKIVIRHLATNNDIKTNFGQIYPVLKENFILVQDERGYFPEVSQDKGLRGVLCDGSKLILMKKGGPDSWDWAFEDFGECPLPTLVNCLLVLKLPDEKDNLVH
jgi:hypothetical protein